MRRENFLSLTVKWNEIKVCRFSHEQQKVAAPLPLVLPSSDSSAAFTRENLVHIYEATLFLAFSSHIKKQETFLIASKRKFRRCFSEVSCLTTWISSFHTHHAFTQVEKERKVSNCFLCTVPLVLPIEYYKIIKLGKVHGVVFLSSSQQVLNFFFSQCLQQWKSRVTSIERIAVKLQQTKLLLLQATTSRKLWLKRKKNFKFSIALFFCIRLLLGRVNTKKLLFY